MTLATQDDVLTFWLGTLDASGMSDADVAARWWKKDPAFDTEVRERFEATYDQIVAGNADAWLATPRGRVAYLIVLDQFSRNMFRDDAKMYAADAKSLAAVREGLAAGEDSGLSAQERVFFYMPLMHSEELADQDRCVAKFEQLSEEHASIESLKNNVKYAIAHRDIVARFGRFPHRNGILGRESTPEEVEFLKQPGSSF